MPNRKAPKLYQKYLIDKSDERRMLFEQIRALYSPNKGIYPGSFVHITPSFFIPDMTYIDSDRRISKYFNDEGVIQYIESNKTYDGSASIRSFQADFASDLPIDERSFDVMFSFYAGFISQSCKKYLKNEGVLVCNNSHGDASLAYADPDYALIAVIKRRGSSFRVTDDDLGLYFIKRDGSPIDKDKVLDKMVGESFTKKGYAYVFRLSRKADGDS